jgi:hypothetical protein
VVGDLDQRAKMHAVADMLAPDAIGGGEESGVRRGIVGRQERRKVLGRRRGAEKIGLASPG